MLHPGDEPDPQHALECVQEALDDDLEPTATANEYDRWLQHKPVEERVEYYTSETLTKHFGWNKLKFKAGVKFTDLNVARPERILADAGDNYDWECERDA